MVAHFVVLKDGTIHQLHPISHKLDASSKLNDNTIAIEFGGLFIWGDKFGKTFYGKITKNKGTDKEKTIKLTYEIPTIEQIDAGRALIKYLKDHSGTNISNIFAHAHGKEQKPNCCGVHIWQNIGLWGVHKLNLKVEGTRYKISEFVDNGSDNIPDCDRYINVIRARIRENDRSYIQGGYIPSSYSCSAPKAIIESTDNRSQPGFRLTPSIPVILRSFYEPSGMVG